MTELKEIPRGSIFKEVSFSIGEKVIEKWAYSDGVGELVQVPIEYDDKTWTKDPVNYEDMESMFWRKFRRPDDCDWESLFEKKDETIRKD